MDLQFMKDFYVTVAAMDVEMVTLQTRLRALADENLLIQARMNEIEKQRKSTIEQAITGMKNSQSINPSPLEEKL